MLNLSEIAKKFRGRTIKVLTIYYAKHYVEEEEVFTAESVFHLTAYDDD
jgi:hypothetical protein